MSFQVLDSQQVIQNLKNKSNPFFNEYYAFYSSWLDGIVTDPHLMCIPIDDHMVHRGDGVFEAMKAISNSVYLLEEHLDRLFTSAKKIFMNDLISRQKVKDAIFETLKVANQPQASIRVFLSRGPGNFSVNPYDAIGPQLYVIVMKLNEPTQEKYEKGVKIGQSYTPIKSSLMAQIKSCNYLPNVLMKKEALDRKLDFVIGIDPEGCITEGPTENIIIVDNNGVLVHPQWDYILKGTTMQRLFELAHKQGMPTAMRAISIEDLLSAREIMMIGTSINILPVVQFDNHLITEGKPGPIAKQLQQILVNDIMSL